MKELKTHLHFPPKTPNNYNFFPTFDTHPCISHLKFNYCTAFLHFTCNKIINVIYVHVYCNYLKNTESYPLRQSRGTTWAFTTWQANPWFNSENPIKMSCWYIMKIQLLDAWLQCICNLQTLAVFESCP